MNKQIVKKAAALGIVAVLSVGAVFAKPHQSNSKDWKHRDDVGFSERPIPPDNKDAEFNERQMKPDGKGTDFNNKRPIPPDNKDADFNDRQMQPDGRGADFNNERPMVNDAAGATENSIMGKWIIRDENKAVKVELGRRGNMEIEWMQGFTAETEWKGSWTATDTEITFTVKSKETETWTNGAKAETRESLNAVWKLQYSRNDGGTLTLSGSDLPKELANLTLSRQGR